MLDSVGVGKSPYGIVVKVVHPPGAGGLLSLLSVWRCLLPIIAIVKVIVVSHHSGRSEESYVDAERSNFGKSTLLISSSIALYFRRSFGKLNMTGLQF